MIADELAARVGGECSEQLGATTVDVALDRWLEAIAAARGLGATFFDFLTAVDEGDGAACVVAHLYAPPAGPHVTVRTKTGAGEPIASVTSVFAGASWHERETHEMFGIDFTGHPDLRPLLLPHGFEGHPLRKGFALAAREEKPWPGELE